MSTPRWVDTHVDELAAALSALRADGDLVESWGTRLAERLLAGGRVLAAGNGGSAAEAQHFTAELVGRFQGERTPLSALCLSAETSSLTAIGNDYGYDEVFARQVQAHGRPGDVLILLSTSGSSANLLRAAERAHSIGVEVWAMTGRAPNPLAELADEVLAVDAPSTSAVQEVHLVAVHAICASLDAQVHRSSGAEPAAVERTAARRVVVVGDAMLDVDVHGASERLSPDAPVPVVDVTARSESPGGAGLTALLCAAPDVNVVLIAPLATDQAGRRLRAALGDHVRVVAVDHAGPTRVKTRVRSGGQSVVRVDEGGPGEPGDVVVEAIRAELSAADVILVSDYGAGTTRDPALRELLAEVAHDTLLVWDPHPRGGEPVPGAALVTPNAAEAARFFTEGGPADHARDLRPQFEAKAVAVTAGAQGAWLALDGSEVMFVPAPTVSGGDPCGAGDRFAASAAVSLARGSVLSEAVVAAVADASAWVASGGADAFRRPSTRPSAQRADDPVAAVRARGGTVVATGGCFDVLHAGHVACLEAARRLGDILVVLLNSDSSVRRLKGADRPAVAQADRARVLSALAGVDDVIVFDEDDPRAALERLRPDIWAKGGDYGGAELPEAELVRSWGGRIVLLPYLDGRSTTSILSTARPSTQEIS